jgi:hypothetical protein
MHIRKRAVTDLDLQGWHTRHRPYCTAAAHVIWVLATGDVAIVMSRRNLVRWEGPKCTLT